MCCVSAVLRRFREVLHMERTQSVKLSFLNHNLPIPNEVSSSVCELLYVHPGVQRLSRIVFSACFCAPCVILGGAARGLQTTLAHLAVALHGALISRFDASCMQVYRRWCGMSGVLARLFFHPAVAVSCLTVGCCCRHSTPQVYRHWGGIFGFLAQHPALTWQPSSKLFLRNTISTHAPLIRS
jgi:hypothetical protein